MQKSAAEMIDPALAPVPHAARDAACGDRLLFDQHHAHDADRAPHEGQRRELEGFSRVPLQIEGLVQQQVSVGEEKQRHAGGQEPLEIKAQHMDGRGPGDKIEAESRRVIQDHEEDADALQQIDVMQSVFGICVVHGCCPLFIAVIRR